MKPKLRNITVEQRLTDDNKFIAFINDDRTRWGEGRSPAEAIGAVILSHQCELDYKLEA